MTADQRVVAASPTLRVVLEPDPNVESPLTSDEPFQLVSWAPDVRGTIPTPSEDPTVWAERWQKRHRGGVLWPLWAYRHSGIALRIASSRFDTGFPDPRWDVGFVGFCTVTAANLRYEWDGNIDHARIYIEDTLATYAQWLNGDCWGYRIERRHDPDKPWTCVDSCLGFYGSDWATNGMARYWPPDVQQLVAVQARPA